MADIRINELPLATGPTAPIATDNIALDGSTTRKSSLASIADAINPPASEAEAEAGVNSVKRMTPLTVKQSIASEVGETIASAADGDKASKLPVTTGNGLRILQVSESELSIEAKVSAPSALGMRGFDNSFTDPQMIDRANYSISGAFAWQTAASGSSEGLLTLNNSFAVSAANIVASSPPMAVEHDVSEWYEGQFGVAGSLGSGVAAARLEVEFFSDIAGTVSLGRRLIGTATTNVQTIAIGAAHRAPSTARSARFVMTRVGNATAVNSATFSNLSKVRVKSLDRDVQFRVGNSGSATAHYRSLQEAVDCVSQAARPRNKSYPKEVTASARVGVSLMIEAGHKLTEGLCVAFGDYSWFEILSEDAEVLLDAAFIGKSAIPFYARSGGGSAPDDGADESEHLIMGYQAMMPALACIINMEGLYDNGYVAIEGSTGLVRPGFGVKRAGHNGLDCRASRISADYTIFTGANNHALRAAYSATVSAQGINGDFAGQSPDADSFNALDVSRTSMVHARLSTFKNAGKIYTGAGTTVSAMAAVNIRRNSTCTLQDADLSGATGNTTNGVGGIHVQHNSRVSMFGAKVNDIVSNYPVRVTTGGRIDADTLEILRRPNASLAIYFDVGGVFTGDGVVTSTVAAPTSRAINEGDISLSNFNAPGGDGIYYNPNSPDLFGMGKFSTSGATGGKIYLAPDGLERSSRTGTGTDDHYQFYNGNGKVGSIASSLAGTRYYLTATVWIGTHTATPEGAIPAPVGCICSDITGGKAYIKATGTGNTGWVVIGTQT